MNTDNFFNTNPSVHYSKEDISKLHDMCSNLYLDKGPWSVIERGSGLYVSAKEIDMHYMEFIFYWLIPTIFMSVASSTKNKEVSVTDVYVVDSYSSIDYSEIYELLFGSDNLIDSCYYHYKQLTDNNVFSFKHK